MDSSKLFQQIIATFDACSSAQIVGTPMDVGLIFAAYIQFCRSGDISSLEMGSK